jgi:hypothetical protein
MGIWGGEGGLVIRGGMLGGDGRRGRWVENKDRRTVGPSLPDDRELRYG